jgi:uncharacterized protein (TIGR01244 family)
MEFMALDDRMLVSGQIQASDMAEMAQKGITTIVNNRPDGEEEGQPSSTLLEMAAREAGLDYLHLPISAEFSEDKISAMLNALETSPGLVLAFCKSGTRSAYLWALARARWGADVDDMILRARYAGYNLLPILPWLKKGAGGQA